MPARADAEETQAMRINPGVGRALLACIFLASSSPGLNAADLTGAWASHTDLCDKIFVKKGARISFTDDSDLFGSGLIIEPGKIRGKMAECTIRSSKEEGDTVHMVAECATSISHSTLQLRMRIVDKDRIIRTHAGLPELDTPYVRCPSQ
jgi:hypothetical protein